MKRLLFLGGSRASRRHFNPVGRQVDRPLVDAQLTERPSYVDLADVVLDRAERAFAARTDGTLLERYALEAAIDVLSTPDARVYNYLPELAMREVRDALDRNAA